MIISLGNLPKPNKVFVPALSDAPNTIQHQPIYFFGITLSLLLLLLLLYNALFLLLLLLLLFH